MNQYCRYCAWMCCGDANYCGKHKKCYSDDAIKRINKCKDFEFNEMDALDPDKTYKPRIKNETDKDQISIFDVLNDAH